MSSPASPAFLDRLLHRLESFASGHGRGLRTRLRTVPHRAITGHTGAAMQHRLPLPLSSGDEPCLPDCAPGATTSTDRSCPANRPWSRLRQRRAVTLVEVMISLILLATCMLGFLTAFVHSRKVTESNVLHAAASSLIYGIIEQMKGKDYTTLLPSLTPDNASTPATPPPYVRVRIKSRCYLLAEVCVHEGDGYPQYPQGADDHAGPAGHRGECRCH